ncbi:MAG: CPBP family intramembrane glutamic endopeptidase [Flavicella sp.]
MKTKVYNALNKSQIVVFVMLIAPLFGFIDRNLVFFFGLGIALFVFRESKFDKSKFGLEEQLQWKTLYRSLLYAVAIFFLDAIVIGPVLENLLGPTDLSSFDSIIGNFTNYLILLLIMWVFAAFGEEFLHRGFYMKWMAEYLGNTKKHWIISSIITSFYFAMGHIYQGISGAVGVFFWSLMVSFSFMKNRKNLWLVILVHGFYDTIAITLHYFDKLEVISNWLSHMCQ